MKLISSLAVVALLLSTTAFAAAPDLGGKWKWKYERSNGESFDVVMDLKQEGSKLSGTVKANDQTMKVQDGKVAADGQISFYITAELNSGPFKIDFSGKAQGEKIVGKTEYKNDEGETREREWTATRDKTRDLTGKWNSVFKRQDGTPMETTLELKQSGEKLTGTQSFNDNKTEISDGKVQGENVTFRIVRERNGRSITTKYRGKIQPNNSIKGEIESDWTGEVRKLEWEAKKAN